VRSRTTICHLLIFHTAYTSRSPPRYSSSLLPHCQNARRPERLYSHPYSRALLVARRQAGVHPFSHSSLPPSRGIRYTKHRSDLAKFIVRGVAYQVRHTRDPIADDCLPRLEHDVALFKELGLNTLYVCKCAYPPGFPLRRR
jgi:hypothetical protein